MAAHRLQQPEKLLRAIQIPPTCNGWRIDGREQTYRRRNIKHVEEFI